MTRQFGARRLDVQAFAEEGAQLAGEEPLRGFPRLAQESQDPRRDVALRWAARGELRNPAHVHPEVWLHLQASCVLPMTCQRCLELLDVPLEVDRPFRFVADEAQAAAQDDESEEDLLALSRTFDLMELVEDELLMAIPAVPRHGTCPVPVRLVVQDAAYEEAAPENPFARLKALRTPPGD